MRHKHKKKSLRKKYKKLAAALAGAAVVSTAMLPGAALPRALAAENPASGRPEIVREHHVRSGSPVAVVRDNAYKYGFDADNDRFSLLSKTDSKAVVEVRTGTQTFKVDLEKTRRGDWRITTIRGIGNAKYPATYYPASWFERGPVYRYTGAGEPVIQKILYQATAFRDWSWNEGAYPRDMSFGVISYDPRLGNRSGEIPDDIFQQLTTIDFNKYIAIYTYLGTTGPTGYGIGIERVAEIGNNLVVTINTKSPEAGQTNPSATKAFDIVRIDRAAFASGQSSEIIIVDQNGTVLFDYNLNLP